MGELAISIMDDHYPIMIDGFRRQLAELDNVEDLKSIEKQAATLAQAYQTVHRSIEKANPLNEIACEAAAKIGEILGEGKRGNPHGELNGDASLFNSDARKRYRKIAKVEEEKRQTYYAICNEQGESISQNGVLRYGTGLPANYSSESVEWYTPKEYIRAVHEVLGNVDLDPASCPLANKTIGAGKIFTKEDDGLSRDWFGNVFLNPPYGRDGTESVAGMFCRKAIDEYIAGNVEAAIILVNSAHAQKWQKPLYQFPVCFVDRRIAFESSDGVINKAPTFMNIFVYIGPDKAKFAGVFEQYGYVMERIHVD